MLVDGIADSPILSLIDQIFKLRHQGENVLALHIGEPDLETPSGIRQTACQALTCLPPFIQRAALWGLEQGEEDAARFRDIFRRRRDLLSGLLDGAPGLQCPRPEGAFYVFPRFHAPITSVEFSSALLREERVAVVPGVAFGPHGEHPVRPSYTAPKMSSGRA